jgi:hypothetical protein
VKLRPKLAAAPRKSSYVDSVGGGGGGGRERRTKKGTPARPPPGKDFPPLTSGFARAANFLDCRRYRPIIIMELDDGREAKSRCLNCVSLA